MKKSLIQCLLLFLISFPASVWSDEISTISWSGYEWEVKASSRPLAPGPNYFSRSKSSVFIDDEGLHMLIRNQKARWLCSEIKTENLTGYGTYRLILKAKLEDFPPQAVFGFFTWSDNPEFYHREIDIELSAWNQHPAPIGQFTVQPHTLAKNNKRINMPLNIRTLALQFVRTPEKTYFRIEDAGKNSTIAEWEYPGSLPEGDERLHINLWLYKSLTDNLKDNLEIILKEFTFTPYLQNGDAE